MEIPNQFLGLDQQAEVLKAVAEVRDLDRPSLA